MPKSANSDIRIHLEPVVIEKIIDRCRTHFGRFSIERCLSHLKSWAKEELTNPSLRAFYITSGYRPLIDELNSDKLRRALNKHSTNNGISLNTDRHLRDLLCCYAFGNQTYSDIEPSLKKGPNKSQYTILEKELKINVNAHQPPVGERNLYYGALKFQIVNICAYTKYLRFTWHSDIVYPKIGVSCTFDENAKEFFKLDPMEPLFLPIDQDRILRVTHHTSEEGLDCLLALIIEDSLGNRFKTAPILFSLCYKPDY